MGNLMLILKQYSVLSNYKQEATVQTALVNENQEVVIAEIKKMLIQKLDYSEKDHRLSVLDEMRKIDFGDVSPEKFAEAIVDNLPRVFHTANRVTKTEAIRRFHNKNVGDQSRTLVETATMLVSEGFTGKAENDKM